jgi:hypothetical protein
MPTILARTCVRRYRAGAEAGIKRAITVQQRVDDAHWSLAMALAWITYRTEQAVIKITHGRWAPTETAISDLLSALRSGKLIAHGLFEGERTPHPIETALWSTFEIVVKQTMFAGHMVLPTSGYGEEDRLSANPIVMLHRPGGQSQETMASGQAIRSRRKAMPRVSLD